MPAGPRWAAFAGIAVGLTTLLLALARLPQPSVSAPDTDSDLPVPARSFPPGVLLLNVALSQGVFGVLLLAGAWYTEIPLAALGIAPTPLSTGFPGLAVGVGLGIVLYLGNELASGVAGAAGIEHAEELRRLLAPEDARGWVVLLGGVLPVVAVVEELFFRAALVGALAAGFPVSPWLLAVVASVAFGIAHGAQGAAGMAVAGGLGFALAVAFVLTNSLLAVVVAHYLVNTLEFVVHESGPGRRLTV